MIRTTRSVLAACLLLFALTAAANEFTLKDTQGQIHPLSDYRGQWVLVNFWATWCGPCLDELPDLAALYKAHKGKDLMVFGVVMEYPSAKIVQNFLGKNPVPYPVVLGDYRIAKQVGIVDVLPTSYLFDPTGKPVSAQAGEVTRSSVEEYIRSTK